VKTISISKLKRHLIYFSLSFLITTLILSFRGQLLEDTLRNFYRKNICNCDTLRPIEVLDSLGVPIIDFFSISGYHIGKQRNPVSVCFKADEYYLKNEIIKFNNCVDWISDNSTLEDTVRYLNYNYDWLYGMQKPWKSAMAQGLSIKVFTQAYELSKDTIFLFFISEFINSFYVPVDSGGVTYFINDTTWWYEEYSHVNGDNPMILNGMLFCLDNLYYNFEKTGNKHSLDLFKKGINALENKLNIYDTGNLSYYDNQKNMANEYYHNIHVKFLKKFYEITKNETLKSYYDKWKLYKSENYIISCVKKPNKTFIVLFVGLIIIFYLLFILRLLKKFYLFFLNNKNK